MGYSTDARLAEHSTAARWHRRCIIHQHASRWPSSRNGKLDAYSRHSETRPGKGEIRIKPNSVIRHMKLVWQPQPALAANAPYVRYQTYGHNVVLCRSARTDGPQGQEGCRSVPKCQNGLIERSVRLPFRAEAPKWVDRKVREAAVPSRAPGRMRRKAGNLRMEMGCLHRKVRTRHQTQDVKSPPEYGWHSTAIRCHD